MPIIRVVQYQQEKTCCKFPLKRIDQSYVVDSTYKIHAYNLTNFQYDSSSRDKSDKQVISSSLMHGSQKGSANIRVLTLYFNIMSSLGKRIFN